MTENELFKDENDSLFVIEYPPANRFQNSVAWANFDDESKEMLGHDPQVVISAYRLNDLDDEDLVTLMRKASERASFIHARYAARQMIEERGKAAELIQRYGVDTARKVVRDFSKYAHESEEIKRMVDEINGIILEIEGAAAHAVAKPSNRAGHIYVVSSAGYYKIGRAKEVTRRVYQFSTEYPHPVELVMSAPADDMHEKESTLHRHFADKRVRGEWFSLNDDDLSVIREMLGING